jgi:hypothetical protein
MTALLQGSAISVFFLYSPEDGGSQLPSSGPVECKSGTTLSVYEIDSLSGTK